MNRHYWFILEVETGLLDGWYFNGAVAERVLQHVDRTRPAFTHVLAKAEGSPRCGIPHARSMSSTPPPPKHLIAGERWKQSAGESWFVLEVETCKLDGWYAHGEDSDRISLLYDRKRPKLTHVSARVEGGSACPITKARCLGE